MPLTNEQWNEHLEQGHRLVARHMDEVDTLFTRQEKEILNLDKADLLEAMQRHGQERATLRSQHFQEYSDWSSEKR